MDTLQQQAAFEITARDIAAIDRVLSQIDRRNAQLESFVYWKLALKFFKELDLRFALMEDRTAVEPFHRAILTSMLAATECLRALTESISKEDLARISLSIEALDANLKFLRSKYQQWYAFVDPRTIETVNKAIENPPQKRMFLSDPSKPSNANPSITVITITHPKMNTFPLSF